MERYVCARRPPARLPRSTRPPSWILTPIWHLKAATTREVRQRIRAVLEWAVALDMHSDNPCDRVVPVLGPRNDIVIVTHRQALPHKDVAAAIDTVLGGSAQPAGRLAFEFLVLTAARSDEVRLATWDEIDTAGAVWTVPTTRMKTKRERRVPHWWTRPLEISRARRQGIEQADLLVHLVDSDRAPAPGRTVAPVRGYLTWRPGPAAPRSRLGFGRAPRLL